MYKNNLMTEHDNNLVYTYKTIERWHLLGLFKKIGRLIIKPVERLLAKNKAPLFFFDFYRLYFFSIN